MIYVKTQNKYLLVLWKKKKIQSFCDNENQAYLITNKDVIILNIFRTQIII